MFRTVMGVRKILALCGLVFAFSATSVSAHTRADTVLSVFTDGTFPGVGAFDDAGNFYGFQGTGGTGSACGSGGCGTVFKLAPDGTRTVIHNFQGPPTDGYTPTGITIGKDGNLYGTTEYGGARGTGSGMVYKLTQDGQETILYSFPVPKRGGSKAPQGIWPTGGVIFGKDGNLYGTTWHGGINNKCGEGGCGTVFKLTLQGVHTVLYAFKGAGDACQAYSGVAQDKAGNLYGATLGCGGGNNGTVYKISPDGTETTLHLFTDSSDGSEPGAAPVFDKAGNLIGSTGVGGNTGCAGGGCGVVYKIAPDGTYTILHTFAGMVWGQGTDQDGGVAGRPMHSDRMGNIYSTTLWGGNEYCDKTYGCGTVYKVAPNGTVSVIYTFKGPDNNDGAYPYDGVIPGNGDDGKYLYGTTPFGPNCCGMVYKLRK